MPEMRSSRYEMIAVQDARDLILAHTLALPSESIRITEAAGRILAQDIIAKENLPPFAGSAVDGYAIVVSSENAPRRVLEEITAGRTSTLVLDSNTAVRIMTGAPLPFGANAVVMVEHATEREGRLSVERTVHVGENVIPVGLDVTAGAVVVESGTQLGSTEIALLATVGAVQFPVFRRPRVAVLSTGDELVDPSEPVASGKVRDSNRYGLLAAVTEAGCDAVSLGRVRDDKSAQEARIGEGLAQADVLITSGGVSVGSRDLIKPILEELGEVHFGRVAIKPGKPLTFATIGKKLAFGLPGFPVSSMVAFELFVRPSLLKMQGHRRIERARVTVTLEHDVAATVDRTEFQRAVVCHKHGKLWARTTGVQASSRILSMVGANALLEIAPGEGTLVKGTEVAALLVGPIE